MNKQDANPGKNLDPFSFKREPRNETRHFCGVFPALLFPLIIILILWTGNLHGDSYPAGMNKRYVFQTGAAKDKDAIRIIFYRVGENKTPTPAGEITLPEKIGAVHGYRLTENMLYITTWKHSFVIGLQDLTNPVIEKTETGESFKMYKPLKDPLQIKTGQYQLTLKPWHNIMIRGKSTWGALYGIADPAGNNIKKQFLLANGKVEPVDLNRTIIANLDSPQKIKFCAHLDYTEKEEYREGKPYRYKVLDCQGGPGESGAAPGKFLPGSKENHEKWCRTAYKYVKEKGLLMDGELWQKERFFDSINHSAGYKLNSAVCSRGEGGKGFAVILMDFYGYIPRSQVLAVLETGGKKVEPGILALLGGVDTGGESTRTFKIKYLGMFNRRLCLIVEDQRYGGNVDLVISGLDSLTIKISPPDQVR